MVASAHQCNRDGCRFLLARCRPQSEAVPGLFETYKIPCLIDRWCLCHTFQAPFQSQGWATTRFADLQDAAQPTYQFCLLPLNCFQMFHFHCCTTIYFCKLFPLVSLITLLFFFCLSIKQHIFRFNHSLSHPTGYMEGPFLLGDTQELLIMLQWLESISTLTGQKSFTWSATPSSLLQLVEACAPPGLCGHMCFRMLVKGTLAEVGQTQWVQGPTSRSWRAC